MTHERRSAPRRFADIPIDVTDSISGEVVGRVGNLSRNGMMLICHQPLRDDALYQLRFNLVVDEGADTAVEAGVHTMWTEPASTNNYQWSGLRIISISGPAATSLDRWLDQHPG